MANVQCLPQKARFFQAGSSAFIFKALLCPEQKIILYIEDIVHKFTLPSLLVVDRRAETVLVYNVCKLLPQHRQCVGSNLESESVASSLLQLILVFARHVSNKETAITGPTICS